MKNMKSTPINPEIRQHVYDLLEDSLDLENYPLPESQIVENAFAEGKKCERLYSMAYSLKQRLLSEATPPRENDLEQLIDCIESIGREISFKMFNYGWYFALQNANDSGSSSKYNFFSEDY
ncbi:MAG: hypothetical protein LUH07_06880 [Lachnospiraceae bacterium]|nr:hypothetical protein [Lachnospiraceae bacterium]